jgi:hypothetical protein
MGLLEESRERLSTLLASRNYDLSTPVIVAPLSMDDALGALVNPEFAHARGDERVLQARVGDSIGQAFTHRPSNWNGTVADALHLDLAHLRERAIFVAMQNAVMRSLGLCGATAHCRDEDPTRCGPVIAHELAARFHQVRVVLIGLQPAILRALVARFGADAVRVADLCAERIGTWPSDVLVYDAERDLASLIDWCEVGLATGSSLVNGTIDEIRDRFQAASKPVLFYGNTISAAAALVSLDRICPFGR